MSDELEGKEIWEEWMKELTPPYTVSYNPAGILYAKERIAELEAENKTLRDMLEEAAEALESAGEGHGVNYHAYGIEIRALLEQEKEK